MNPVTFNCTVLRDGHQSLAATRMKTEDMLPNIFRIFDCVNDPRNMETSIRAAKKAGAQAHGTICYTTSPVHTTQSFVDMGRELADMGGGRHRHQGHGRPHPPLCDP